MLSEEKVSFGHIIGITRYHVVSLRLDVAMLPLSHSSTSETSAMNAKAQVLAQTRAPDGLYTCGSRREIHRGDGRRQSVEYWLQLNRRARFPCAHCAQYARSISGRYKPSPSRSQMASACVKCSCALSACPVSACNWPATYSVLASA